MSTRLTESYINRINAVTREVIVYDSLVPGLFIRVSPRGIRSWGFLTRLSDGRKVRMKLRRWPAMTLVAARKEARALLAKAEAGDDPRGEPEPPAALALRELATAFVNGWCRPRNRHWMQQERALRLVVGEEWGWWDRPVAEITRLEISEQLRGMIGPDGKRAIRANRVHAVLHRMFKWAAGQGYIEASPMTEMGKPSPERIRDRVLTDDEVRAVWMACHKWRRGDHLHPMAGAVLLALLTGQRMGECVGLRWDEVGPDGVWRLPAARVKNKHAHSVPLPKSALELLQAMPKGTPCPFGGKPVGTQEKAKLDRLMKTELGDAFQPFHLHDLRRTVRSGLAAAGVSWEVQHRVQNHLSPLGRMDAIYQRHDYTDELRAALAAWESRLLTIVRQIRAVA